MFLQIGNQASALLQIAADEVEHVAIVRGIVRNLWQANLPFCGDALQSLMVQFPYPLALVLYLIKILNLCPQEGSVDFRREEA